MYIENISYFCKEFNKKVSCKINKNIDTKSKNLNKMNYSTKEINNNFKIKVAGRTENGEKINTLVGVSGAIALIGETMFCKLLDRAFASTGDKCVCKLRRGLKFSFYCI